MSEKGWIKKKRRYTPHGLEGLKQEGTDQHSEERISSKHCGREVVEQEGCSPCGEGKEQEGSLCPP